MSAATGGAQAPAVSRALKPQQLTGAASKSYSVASAWEKSAALTDEQLRAVDQLGELCQQRPYPAHLADDTDPASAPVAPSASAAAASGEEASSSVEQLQDAVLQNAAQFQHWHTELEAACANETEQKYAHYAKLLGGYLEQCASIQAKVDQALSLLDQLSLDQREVAGRTGALSGGAEALMAQRASLVEFGEALRARLRFFDEYESVASQFAATAATASPDGKLLLPLLGRVEECIAYVAANPQYADAVTYATRFRQLQAKALGLVRVRVQAVLRTAAQQVQAAVAEVAAGEGGSGGTGGSGGMARAASSALPRPGSGSMPRAGSGRLAAVPLLPEGAEVSLLYVRFRASAEPSLKGLLQELESRASRPEYAKVLDDLRQLYCTARQQLVSPFVEARLSGLANIPLPQLLRSGADQLQRVAQLEAQLYEQFFSGSAPCATGGGGQHQQHQHQHLAGVQGNGTGAKAAAAAAAATAAAASLPAAEALRPLLEPLATLMYDLLRPRFVQLADIDELCELIDILQHEVLGEALGGGARSGGGGGAGGGSAAAALRPMLLSALSDLQQRLIYRAQASIKEEVSGFVPTIADTDFPERLERLAASKSTPADSGEIHGADEDSGGGEQAAPDPYAQWYGPLRATLLLLSQLYRCLEPRTFSGLAQEAVAACTASVQAAARLVAARSGPLDAQLFVIQHLLLLREQIAPFDVEFAATDIDLDFSHMRDHMRRILSGEVSLFSLGANNAVVQMLSGRGGPRVVAAHTDSKRDLEQQLKAACESYIMGVTKMAVEPMLSFITKVTAVRVAASNNPSLARPLKQQAFGAPAKLAELVSRVNAAMQGQLPAAAVKTSLYLPNPATRAILFRPVKSNIAEAHGQIAQLLEAEYSGEEAAGVPLMQPQQLGAVLDALS